MSASITANQGVSAVVFGSLNASVSVTIGTGKAIFCCFSAPTSSSPFSLTDNVGNTYTAASGGPFTDSANGWTMNCFYCPSSIGNVTTITIHETGSGNNGVFSWCEITGANPNSFVDQQLGAAGSAPANWNNVSVTPGFAGDLIITVVAKSSSQTLTVGGGFTSLQTFTTTRTQDLAYISGGGTSSTGPSWTGGSGGGTAFTIAIRSVPVAVQTVARDFSGQGASFDPGGYTVTGGNCGVIIASYYLGVAAGSTTPFQGIVDSTGDVWQNINTPAGTTGGTDAIFTQIAFCQGMTAGSHHLTLASGQGASVTLAHVTFIEFSDVGILAAVDTTGSSNGTTAQSNTATSGAIAGTPEVALYALVLASGAGVANAAIGTPSGYTSTLVIQTTDTDIGVRHAYRVITSGSGAESDAVTWTDATTRFSQGNVGIIKLTGGGGVQRTIAPGVGALSLPGLAPTLQKIRNIAPGLGGLALNPLPANIFDQVLRPGIGALQIQGRVPTVLQTIPPSGAPSVGSLVIQGLAPTLLKFRTITPSLPTNDADPTAELVPTVLTEWTAKPGVGLLTIQGLVPQEIKDAVLTATVTPDVGVLTMNPLAPTAVVPAGQAGASLPDLGQLQMMGQVPTLLTVRIITPDVGVLVFTQIEPLSRGKVRWHDTPQTPRTWHDT